MTDRAVLEPPIRGDLAGRSTRRPRGLAATARRARAARSGPSTACRFDVRPGEVLALVGESGSGKTTIAQAVMRLVEPTGGRIVHRGRDITAPARRGAAPAARSGSRWSSRTRTSRSIRARRSTRS